MDYNDIIDLPYPNNDWNFLMKHPRMPIASRAKIFSPFAALRGHDEKIAETAKRGIPSALQIVEDEDLQDTFGTEEG